MSEEDESDELVCAGNRYRIYRYTDEFGRGRYRYVMVNEEDEDDGRCRVRSDGVLGWESDAYEGDVGGHDVSSNQGVS